MPDTDNTKLLLLQSHPLFSRLNSEKLETISSLLKWKTYARGDAFGYGEGSYHKLCLLIKGKVKIADYDLTGIELVRDILTAPDIFGDLSLEGSLSPDEYAVALTAGTMVASFSTADFKKILEDHPGMALDFAHTVNKKLRKLEDRHSDLVFRDAKYRLIRFIKSWALSDGSRMGNKIILPNYLTHSDIAGVIATSRQSVNVLFNELRDSGLLFYNRKRIELNDTGTWN
ncbi:Crp/Fnr family transcriptional regulator [Flavitalea sp. BT771]|uniref:Crp/Fnr family transcriptional regulator n=1 Tax=Flavitalea sp. BT771 TaxID=3063329 RepID=UPI0026E410D1|nr:Crp/Fnr family transcriptional regulator [Flavitalea sp. BT771]MDO6435350.1 Crp/Fnr family transcriptional regulator [Flavitalea sp. BT771]MDV6224290.1 Crp/Fnr family transcriptional regulator [Flavitalea sp. BT771]